MNDYCTLLDPLLPLNFVYRSFGEELFRITFDSTSIASAVIACDGPCLLANPALTGLLGYSLNELLGTDLRELIYAEDRSSEEPLARQMARAILSSYDVKQRYRHKDGHLIWALSYISLVQSSDLRKCRILQVQEIARWLPRPISGDRNERQASGELIPNGPFDRASEGRTPVVAGFKVSE
jgi:PAS domain S-box-containing protein